MVSAGREASCGTRIRIGAKKGQKAKSGLATPHKMASGTIEDGGMAERLNAPVLKTFFAIPASTRK